MNDFLPASTPHVAGVPLLSYEQAWVLSSGRPLPVEDPASVRPGQQVVVASALTHPTASSSWFGPSGRLPLAAWTAWSTSDPSWLLEQFPFLSARTHLANPKALHDLSSEAFADPQLSRLTAVVADAGGTATLIGGAVRDGLLGRASKDLDVEVSGISLDRLHALLSAAFPSVDEVGVSFAVFKVGSGIDVTVPRTEVRTGPAHTDFEVVPDPFLPADLAAARRDFTMNAVGLDLATFRLVDPYFGADDLAHGRLRHVSDRFAEDPLRCLRGAQFASRMSLTPALSTLALCQELSSQAASLASERVFDEYVKFLTRPGSRSAALAFLAASSWLPEALAALDGVDAAGGLDALAFTAASLDGLRPLDSFDQDLVASLATLTCWLDDTAAASLLDSLTAMRNLVSSTAKVRAGAHRLLSAAATDVNLKQVAESCNGVQLPASVAAAMAAAAGQDFDFDEVFSRSASLQVWSSTLPSLIGGDDLLAEGMKPGPALGHVLRSVRLAQLEGRITDRSAALHLARSLL